MPISRRSFLSDAPAAGFLSLLLSQSELLEAADAQAGAHSPATRTVGQDYWSNLYASGAQKSRGASASPNKDRDPRFLYYSDKGSLRWAQDIKASELPTFDEDAVVTMEMGGFRPGKLDDSKLAKVRFAQMHLSCQRVTGNEFVGPLVWAAMATVFAGKASKLPAVKDLSFTPSQGGQTMPGAPQLNRVLLSQGAGHLCVNITTTPTTSLLDKILGATVTATKVLTPLLGFPAISAPALQAFYTFYGALEKANPENFLLNASQNDVAVTQKGAESSLISANSLKLLSGDYILIPAAHEADFAKEMDKLIVQDGYLVEKDAVGKLPPDERISQAVQTVSYITLNVRVQPVSSYTSPSSITDRVLEPAASPGSSNSAAQPKSGHKPK
jgi:hypothetical protein